MLIFLPPLSRSPPSDKKEAEVPRINELQGEIRNLKTQFKQVQAEMEASKNKYDGLKSLDSKLKDELVNLQFHRICVSKLYVYCNTVVLFTL
jgi:hypothetical protein